MMGADGIDNIIGLTVFSGKITTDNGMRSLNFMVHGLSHIM